MSSPRRAAVGYAAALLAGGLLFFLSFAAIFNGSWALLALFVLGYGGAGALAVRLGGVRPLPVALALIAPAAPWVMWLFPASVPEAGLGRALLWPALVALMACLGWLGGYAVARSRCAVS